MTTIIDGRDIDTMYVGDAVDLLKTELASVQAEAGLLRTSLQDEQLRNGVLSNTMHDLEIDVTTHRGHVAELQNQVAAEVQNRIAAARRATDFEADLTTTNEFMNDVAKRRAWCSEFEEYMNELNDLLSSGFQFQPRTRNYVVAVRFTTTFERTIRVSDARNSDEARDRVDNMDTRERYMAADLSPDAIFAESTRDEYDIMDVSRADDD
jgi:hypothetical protein